MRRFFGGCNSKDGILNSVDVAARYKVGSDYFLEHDKSKQSLDVRQGFSSIFLINRNRKNKKFQIYFS